MGGNDGRPSRGLALRARCPTLELGRRWWQGRRGRTDEREEAGRGNGGDGAGEGEEEEEEGRWEATTGVRRVGSCCALAATVAAAGARADRRAGGTTLNHLYIQADRAFGSFTDRFSVGLLYIYL